MCVLPVGPESNTDKTSGDNIEGYLRSNVSGEWYIGGLDNVFHLELRWGLSYRAQIDAERYFCSIALPSENITM